MYRRITMLLLLLAGSAEAQLWRKLHPDSILQMDLRFLPAPIIYRTPETSWGFGLSTSYYFNTASAPQRAKTRSSNIQLQAVRTLRQQTIVQMVSEVFTPDERFYIRFYTGYRDYLDRFYGIGPATGDSEREDYRFESWVTATNVLYNVGNNNFVGLNLRSQTMFRLRSDSLGALNSGNVPGGLGSRVVGFGPEWRMDTRDNPFAPAKGHYVNVFARIHPSWQADYFSYAVFRADARIYRPIGRENVLAGRVSYLQNFGQVPFRELAMIGGDNGLRGYFFGRYRDQSLFEIHAEYRFVIWKIVRGALFTGIGQLGEHPGDYFNTFWKGSYGAGIRLLANKKERITMRIDYGLTLTGQSALYIEFNEAF